MDNKMEVTEVTLENMPELRFQPDWKRLADILTRAKGTNRSMGQFAAACEVSPATFTRIVQGYYKKPLSDKILMAIFANADPKAGITWNELLRSNGYDVQEEEQRQPEKQAESGERKAESPRAKFLRSIMPIIQEELISRGFACTTFPYPNPSTPKETNVFGLSRINRGRKIKIIGHEPSYLRVFECYSYAFNDGGRMDPKQDNRGLSELMDLHSGVFLKDLWEPETMQDTSYAFVFENADAFDMFVEMTQKITVNGYMSCILIDMDKRIVLKEVMIPRKNGAAPLPSLFALPYMEVEE